MEEIKAGSEQLTVRSKVTTAYCQLSADPAFLKSIKTGKLLCFGFAPYFAKNKPVNTLFEIRSEAELSDNHTLLMEIGNGYCSYAYLNRAANAIDGLRYFSFEETAAEESLSEIIKNISEAKRQAAVVCSSFPQALLTPAKLFVQDYSMLDTVYGQPSQAYFHDDIPEWQMVNAYSFPASLRRLFDEAFSSVAMYHAYTPAIKIYSGYVADNQLLVHFTEQNFRVLLKKDAAIQLAQTYSYKTSLDVVYYLLKICYEFDLRQQSVHIIVSGLVEENSGLFTELRQYFSNVHFTHPPEIAFPGNTHPHHFFTSLFNLAACVS